MNFSFPNELFFELLKSFKSIQTGIKANIHSIYIMKVVGKGELNFTQLGFSSEFYRSPDPQPVQMSLVIGIFFLDIL